MSERATWTSPDGSFRVSYPLPLFHEIEFDVTEGYRRIPRGGIEVGGVLLGRIRGSDIEIEAKRPIECEHLLGPSFKLSDKDVSVLRTQIQSMPQDPELLGLQPVGWFIAHTRSELVLTDLELKQFNELFPGPGRFTMLVKPERFKPTRFALFVRDENGETSVDGTADAFILPLPGRAAPVERTAPPPPSGPEPRPVEPIPAQPPVLPEPPAPEPEPEPEPPVARVVEPPVVPVPPSPPPVSPEAVQATPPRVPQQDQSHPVFQTAPIERLEARRNASPVLRDRTSRSGRRALTLLIAAVLGCALGYFLYLQMPPRIIDVKIAPANPGYVVTWPNDQTRSAESLLIRINDSEPTPVSSADATAGQTRIPANDAAVLKVELIARHKMGDSRGIAELVK